MRKMLQLESVKLIFIVTYDFLWFDESIECSKLLFSRISFIEMDCNIKRDDYCFFLEEIEDVDLFLALFSVQEYVGLNINDLFF